MEKWNPEQRMISNCLSECSNLTVCLSVICFILSAGLAKCTCWCMTVPLSFPCPFSAWWLVQKTSSTKLRAKMCVQKQWRWEILQHSHKILIYIWSLSLRLQWQKLMCFVDLMAIWPINLISVKDCNLLWWTELEEKCRSWWFIKNYSQQL